MRLIRFGEKHQEKPGIMFGEQRKDCSAHFTDWNHDFFQNGGLVELQALVDKEGANLPDVPENARWGSPIPRPGMIMCVGLNYADHAAEAGMDIPKEPLVFMKATNTMAGPFDAVDIPRNSTKTDWEVELGVVLQKDALYLEDEAAAADAIAGYCVINDLSERAFQLEKGGQWVKGKSCPGFSPVGPYLVTPDEIEDVLSLGMNLSVNGVQKQNGNTKTMIFKPAYTIWYLSQLMLLEAGDLISTGTPPGVGLGFDPPEYLSSGDEVELSIAGLGTQRQQYK
ncbi:MAG: fumarylacetoacetate hydrolase family protein [Saprospiraceae bacterium]|nr:fumarylacetoacetate hydrolase family protein [Saprospiraceae bacterium]